MQYIWSPWRMKYIEAGNSKTECVFCKTIAQSDGAENLVVHRGQRSFVVLNRYPYTSGHLMVVPYAHVPSLEELDTETRAEMMELATRYIQILRSVYRPDGFNLGINIGAPAGAGIAEHIHLHIVPRWAGDTNFMSVLAEIRVLPEALEDTYQKIIQAQQALR